MKMILPEPTKTIDDGLTADDRKIAGYVRGRLYIFAIILCVIITSSAAEFGNPFLAGVLFIGLIITAIIGIGKLSDKQCKDMDCKPNNNFHNANDIGNINEVNITDVTHPCSINPASPYNSMHRHN